MANLDMGRVMLTESGRRKVAEAQAEHKQVAVDLGFPEEEEVQPPKPMLVLRWNTKIPSDEPGAESPGGVELDLVLESDDFTLL